MPGVRGVRGVGAGVVGVATWTRSLGAGVVGVGACGDIGAKDAAGVMGAFDESFGVIGTTGGRCGDIGDHVGTAAAPGDIGDHVGTAAPGDIGDHVVTAGARGDIGNHVGADGAPGDIGNIVTAGVIGVATVLGVIGVTTVHEARMAATRLGGGGGAGGGGGGGLGQPSKARGASPNTAEGSECVSTSPEGAWNVYSVTFTLTCQPRSTACCASICGGGGPQGAFGLWSESAADNADPHESPCVAVQARLLAKAGSGLYGKSGCEGSAATVLEVRGL